MTDTLPPEILASFPNPVEAAILVGALDEQGIQAQAVGSFTSGFQAEAPGEVQVVVGQSDLERAKEVLASRREHQEQIDWSTIDCGDDSPVSPAELGERERVQPLLQFSLASLIGQQTMAAVMAWFVASLIAPGRIGVTFGFAYFTVLTLISLCMFAATIRVASDFRFAAQVWKFLIAAWLLGVGVILIIELAAFVLRLMGSGF